MDKTRKANYNKFQLGRSMVVNDNNVLYMQHESGQQLTDKTQKKII